MSTRLIAVIVLALLMGLVFGGLRVASAADSASQFGGVSQLAVLGQQVTGLVQALEDERDKTTGLLPITSAADLNGVYAATNAAAARVQSLAAGIGGSFPANIQSRVATVLSDITHLHALRISAQASESALAVIVDYSAPITDMIALNDQIAQGTSDATLVNDVQTLDSLSLAKDQAAQQRGILYNAFNQQLFADGELQALLTAQSEELTDLTAFNTTATPAEQSAYNNFVNNVYGTAVNQAQNIELYVVGTGVPNIDAGALNISPAKAPGAWYSAQSAKVDAMQQTELDVARNIVARAQSLQGSAESSAVVTAIVTAIILLLVLLATVAVARSLVGPLRRLREGALNVATVELPERVRLLGEAQDPSISLAVAPIDVLSTDEIGQVARAFDQVHSEAVRLASNEAGLRNSLNAMFVNLSRRSQSLIERLVRMIDSLEQNEGDPERLSNLFAMDHLVTRMRRNSENLLLLAGHDSARKWSDPVSLADVARAAVSEIEHYSRVSLKVQPGIAVTGSAVSDVVHLLAEVIENATIFSAKDTPVHVATQRTDQRRRADRGQRQRGRHSRGASGRDQLAAGQSSRHRRLGLPAHGPVRRGPPGRTARGAGPAAAPVPARADRPRLAAGQRHRAGGQPVRPAVADLRRSVRLPEPGNHGRPRRAHAPGPRRSSPRTTGAMSSCPSPPVPARARPGRPPRRRRTGSAAARRRLRLPATARRVRPRPR